MKKLLLLLIFTSITTLYAHLPTEEQTDLHRKQLEELEYLQKIPSPQCIAIPEGGFVYYFNPLIKPWLEKRFTLSTIQSLREKLSPHLNIPLSKEGFTMASTRKSEEEVDETSYSAIWVRDACWHYFGLKLKDPLKAKNYWIDHNIPSLIEGPKTKDLEVITRFNKGYMPSDAQWFFDSIIAGIYYNLSQSITEMRKKQYYLTQGDTHLKRALGQLTDRDSIAANGDSLPPFSLPESINTLSINNYSTPIPSPISPLR